MNARKSANKKLMGVFGRRKMKGKETDINGRVRGRMDEMRRWMKGYRNGKLFGRD